MAAPCYLGIAVKNPCPIAVIISLARVIMVQNLILSSSTPIIIIINYGLFKIHKKSTY